MGGEGWGGTQTVCGPDARKVLVEPLQHPLPSLGVYNLIHASHPHSLPCPNSAGTLLYPEMAQVKATKDPTEQITQWLGWPASPDPTAPYPLPHDWPGCYLGFHPGSSPALPFPSLRLASPRLQSSEDLPDALLSPRCPPEPQMEGPAGWSSLFTGSTILLCSVQSLIHSFHKPSHFSP